MEIKMPISKLEKDHALFYIKVVSALGLIFSGTFFNKSIFFNSKPAVILNLNIWLYLLAFFGILFGLAMLATSHGDVAKKPASKKSKKKKRKK